MNQESPKLRLTALLLSFFFGYLGVHRFYVGKVGSGVAILLLSLSIIGLAVTSIWVLVDFIVICSGTFRDSSHRLITRWTN